MRNESLYNSEREEQIINILRNQNSVSVNHLAKYFEVSGTTIRSDLAKLEDMGLIIRTHGGATLKSSFQREKQIGERLNNDKKSAIAQKAVSLIEEDETLLIDTGTTTLCLAQALICSDFHNMRIFTNDLEIARLLEGKKNFEIHFLGGKIRNGFHYSYGHQLIEELKRYHFHKLFLAASAISIEGGLTVPNTDLAQLKEAMIQVSKNIILLVDSTKMNQTDFQSFAKLDEIDTLITNQDILPQYEEKLKEQVGHVILA